MFQSSDDFDFDDDVLASSFTVNCENINNLVCKSKENDNKSIVLSNNSKLVCETITSDPNYINISSVKRKNYEEKSDLNTTRKSPNNVLKRKFPGPAGLLPDRNKSLRLSNDPVEKSTGDNEDASNVVICSQQTQTSFEDGPWSTMTKDFLPNKGSVSLLEKFNIDWIKNQATLKKLYNQKAPFLAAMIQTLDVSDAKIPTINITLKDMSGLIQGTILFNLYEEYADHLTVGAVVVLKQFGVLTTGESNNNYLTITQNNLLSIYTSSSKKNMTNVETIKIVIHEINVEEIWKSYKESESCDKQNFVRSSSFNTNYKPNFNKLNIFKKQNSFTNQHISVKSKTSLQEKIFEDNTKKYSFKNTEKIKQPKSVFETSCDDLNLTLDDDFNIPDNFEQNALSQISNKSNEKENSSRIINTEENQQNLKQNKFDKTSLQKNSMLHRSSDETPKKENSAVIASADQREDILKNIFDGIDSDALFDDF